MSDASKIEWTDATWNPIIGCSVVSPGCANCYAMRTAPRIDALSQGVPVEHLAGPFGRLTTPSKSGPVWSGALRLIARKIGEPLRWRRPRRIFVNSMSDLFHESIPDAWIDQVFAVAALTPQHIHQVLTKRPKRMRAYLSHPSTSRRVWELACDMVVEHPRGHGIVLWSDAMAAPAHWLGRRVNVAVWPLPNVWLGVSVEDQRRADERIPVLLATPAALRWISAEPLLGPINLTHVDFDNDSLGDTLTPMTYRDCFERDWKDTSDTPEEDFYDFFDHEPDDAQIHPTLDWVVAGGESGPGARPMHPNWARSLRDQCAAAGVPFLFKQWGAWAASDIGSVSFVTGKGDDPRVAWPDGTITAHGDAGEHGGSGRLIHKVGKKASGRALDGVAHDGFPPLGSGFDPGHPVGAMERAPS